MELDSETSWNMQEDKPWRETLQKRWDKLPAPNTCKSLLRAGKGWAEGLSSNGVFSSVQFRCSQGLKSEVWRGITAGNDHLPLEPITLHRAEPLCQGHVQSNSSGPALWATLSSLPGVWHQRRALGQDWRHYLPQSSHFNLLRSENIREEWEMSKVKLWIRFWKGNETDGRRFQLDKYRRGKEENRGHYIVRMGLRLDQSTLVQNELKPLYLCFQ